MSRIKEIREALGVTQTELAHAMGCTQGNVGHYERGQTLPPERAERLIRFAAKRSLRLTFDQVYGRAPLTGKKIVGQLAQQPAAKAALDEDLSRSIDNSSKG